MIPLANSPYPLKSTESSPTFHSETELVLTAFNVVRGLYFAPDVKADDVLLLEDGKPRSFSVFEGPGTGRRPPLELVLLFDTTTLPPPESKITVLMTHWDRKATYDFANHWGEKESRAVLQKAGADVRVSVYRYDHQQLQRLCRSTSDPQALTSAIHRLPEPIAPDEAVPLALPPGRMSMEALMLKHGAFKRKPTDPLYWPLSWTMEAMIDTLKDSTAAPSSVMRVLVVFSETKGPTQTTPQDVADTANALGIPVYPVVLDFDEYLHHPFVIGIAKAGGGAPAGEIPIDRPEWAQPYDPAATTGPAAGPSPVAGNLSASTGLAVSPSKTVGNGSTVPMVRFGSVGELTGAESIYPSRIDAGVVNDILNVIRDQGLSQYVVGFAPPSSARQRKHNLEVRLKSKSVGKLRGGQRTAVY